MTQNVRKGISVMALAIALTFAAKHQMAASEHLATTQTTPGDPAQDFRDTPASDTSARFARDARRIEGVWEAQVTRRVCATGEPISTFRGMTTFIQGGALIGTNANPNPPTTYGRWQYLGGQQYLAVERFFRYGPDGSFAGVQRITRNITLDLDGRHFTGVNTSQAFDVDGNLIASGCTTDVTTRVE